MRRLAQGSGQAGCLRCGRTCRNARPRLAPVRGYQRPSASKGRQSAGKAGGSGCRGRFDTLAWREVLSAQIDPSFGGPASGSACTCSASVMHLVRVWMPCHPAAGPNDQRAKLCEQRRGDLPIERGRCASQAIPAPVCQARQFFPYKIVAWQTAGPVRHRGRERGPGARDLAARAGNTGRRGRRETTNRVAGRPPMRRRSRYPTRDKFFLISRRPEIMLPVRAGAGPRSAALHVRESS